LQDDDRFVSIFAESILRIVHHASIIVAETEIVQHERRNPYEVELFTYFFLSDVEYNFVVNEIDLRTHLNFIPNYLNVLVSDRHTLHVEETDAVQKFVNYRSVPEASGSWSARLKV
jgi:hypothetical protein